MFYYSLFSLMILSRFVSSSEKSLNLLFYRTFLFVLFIVAGFRYEVGCDWANYTHLFNYISSVGLATIAIQGEISFVAVNNIVKGFGLPFTYVNVVCAFIFFYGFNILAKRQKDPLTFLILAFPILIIGLPMSGIRQAAAMGIICIALVSFIDKKMYKYIFLVFLASTFHSSSLFFLALAPFMRSNLSFKRVFLAIIILSPLLLLESVTDVVATYSTRYLSSSMDSAGALFRVGILALSSLYFFLFLRKKWEKSYPEDYQLVLLGSLAMLGCFCFLALSTTAADRLGFYLMPFQLIIFSRIQFFPAQFRQLATLLPFALFISTFLVWTSFSSFFAACYSPYAIRFF